jgi:hypothetical protein
VFAFQVFHRVPLNVKKIIISVNSKESFSNRPSVCLFFKVTRNANVSQMSSRQKKKIQFQILFKKIKGKNYPGNFLFSRNRTLHSFFFIRSIQFSFNFTTQNPPRVFFFGCVTPVIPPKLPQQPTHDKQIYFKTTKQFSVNLTSSKHTHTHTRKKS